MIDSIAHFVTEASWPEAVGAVLAVVSGGSIIAFAVAMIRDGIKNGW